MYAIVRCLRWVDVDPARHPFDASIAEAIVEAELPNALGSYPTGDERRRLVEDAIDRAFLAAYGPWIAGWRWSSAHGGFVKGYCGAAHTLVGPRARLVKKIVGARTWMSATSTRFPTGTHVPHASRSTTSCLGRDSVCTRPSRSSSSRGARWILAVRTASSMSSTSWPALRRGSPR